MGTEELSQFPLDEEYKKNTGVTPDDIADLRRWLETQPHLPSNHFTDLDLILAFHSCGCSTEVTKQVLDLHFTSRTLFTSYFQDRSFDDRVKKCMDTLLFYPLPTRTKEGYAILYIRLIDYDPKNFFFCDAIKTAFLIIDLWQYKEGTWPGFVLVGDFQGMSLGHIPRLDIPNTQKFLFYVQEALLVKLKGLHFINAHGTIDKVLMLMKPFMKKELLEIFMIHAPGAETVKSYIPIEALPKESGGIYKSIEECKDEMTAMIQAGESYLKNENLKRVTESLRPGKPKSLSDIFGGVEGSFKKLNLD